MPGASESRIFETEQVFESREEGVAYVKKQLAEELIANFRAAKSYADINRAFDDFATKINQTRVRLKIKRYSGGVFQCQRPADIPGSANLIDHHWLMTDKYEAGMGGDCPVPGQGCSDVPFIPTSTKDHSGQSDQMNASCSLVPDVDEDCVNARIAPGRPLGPRLPWNQCQSFASRVLFLCRIKQ